MTNPKILITGASGMLGSKISLVFSSQGFKVLAVYRANKEFVPNGGNIEKIGLDITKKIHSNQFRNIDAIIHCAAVTNVNFCELNKPLCKKVNIEGTRNLINLARTLNVPFIYISTPMVFSGRKGNYKESDKINLPNYYGKTKAEAERIVLKYKKGLVIRANPIGKRPLGAHPSFIQWFVDMAANNRSFNLFTDVVINPVSTTTLSEILTKIVSDFKPGILHVGSKDRVNKAEIWEEVYRHFPNYSGRITKISVNEAHMGKVAPRPHEMWLNVAKAILLGYSMPGWKREVQITLSEIIDRT